MLNYEELEEILEEVTAKITLANRTGELDALLKSWGLENLISKQTFYETNKKGKIVVIGASEVKENILVGIIKDFGLDKNRFEFCLDYDKAKTFQYKKFQYNPDYRVVIFGPVPHSSTGKKDSSSVIAEMKNHEGYPRIEILSGNNEVKITKSNFKAVLVRLIKENYI